MAASTINAPQPPTIQTSALVFWTVTGPAGGAASGAGDGDAGAGALGIGPGVLPVAGAPQLPQKGPCTWAPHLVQNAINHPPCQGLRYETAPRLASRNWLLISRQTSSVCCALYPRLKNPYSYVDFFVDAFSKPRSGTGCKPGLPSGRARRRRGTTVAPPLGVRDYMAMLTRRVGWTRLGIGRAWKGALALFFAWSGTSGSVGAQTQPLEFRVEAAFVYNFAKFVEWPQEAAGTAPITF